MAYTTSNYQTKQALKDAVKAGRAVTLQAPYIGQPVENGREFVEGPWGIHRWYAQVQVRNGIIVSVK